MVTSTRLSLKVGGRRVPKPRKRPQQQSPEAEVPPQTWAEYLWSFWSASEEVAAETAAEEEKEEKKPQHVRTPQVQKAPNHRHAHKPVRIQQPRLQN